MFQGEKSMNGLTSRILSASLLLGAYAFAIDITPGTDPGPGVPYCVDGAKDRGWYSLFDGTQASVDKYFFLPPRQSHGDGGVWDISNGRIYSQQTPQFTGGALFTKKKYKNVEVRMLMKPYYGNDGGLFTRSTATDKSYQVVIDYLGGKAVGGIWGESGLHSINYKPFALQAPDRISITGFHWTEVEKEPPTSWGTKIWDKDRFNWLKVQVYHDDPPYINTWINGYPMIHYEDNTVEKDNLTGYLGIQVHTGKGAWQPGHPNEYKAFLVREIKADTSLLDAYPEWDAAMAAGTCVTAEQSRDTANTVSVSRHGDVERALINWRFDKGHSLQVYGHAERPYTLTLTDIAGRTVYRATGSAGEYHHVIGVSISGIHFLSIQGSGFRRSVKLLPAG